MKNSLLGNLLPVCNMSQEELANVIHWGKFVEENPKFWKQSTLHHTLSFSIVADMQCFALRITSL